ncbi:non-ribosomal peptide synthetase [Actinophytocola gossypii]|uniref:Non-ribosomal peptide synthetase n=1 Tax=Actinophytocola gossypii TaxID=2812003 RepID=A0ABT2J2M5_9PSEU|nr:non-ribosomal peptide synthetase [Actinophytocola gossypii]MCT2581921.1 non-ribosomal peptide synthetase [Actinophytocola gossypii]
MHGLSTPERLRIAAHVALLHRSTGKDSLAVAVRDHVVRVTLDAGTTFDALLTQITESDPSGHVDDRVPEEPTDRHQVLLDAALAAPGTPLAALPLLTGDERATVTAWSTGGDPGSLRTAPFVPVHRLAAERAAATPDRPAAVDADRRLTHAELHRAAGRFATRLRAAGVRPGDPVAVVLPRGVDLVVTQLAILRAGATIVPLDPVNPAARLARMLTVAGARLVVTTDQDRLPAGVTPLPPDPGDGPEVEDVPVHPDQLAYVTFTSGSTGEPKGVALPHRALTSTVAWARREFALTGEDRVGMTASPGFDVSVLDTFAALTAGAAVHAPHAELLTSPADLRAWLVGERITVTFLPTPIGESAVDLTWPAGTALRLVHTGGAALHRHPPAGLPFTLVNLYGLTEVGVWSTSTVVEPGVEGVPAVGSPIDRSDVLVLDAAGEPVPAGVLGEVHVGGIGVARGYLGRPGLTADRFVPHPWRPGERVYRTGDRARWRADGALEYVGRTDHQVQSSGGVRVELGEIEAALVAHPDVGQAVAAQVDGRIVGYVTGAVDAAGLREHLTGRLPRYMVPAELVVLDRLPLTPTGKIDRQALPASGTRAPGAGFEPPRTELERQLADIWRTVLGTEQVGVHDTFFDIGGSSTALIQVYGHLVRVTSREVSLQELYEHPTIAAFARHLGDEPEPVPEPAPVVGRDRARLARMRRGRVEGSR